MNSIKGLGLIYKECSTVLLFIEPVNNVIHDRSCSSHCAVMQSKA